MNGSDLCGRPGQALRLRRLALDHLESDGGSRRGPRLSRTERSRQDDDPPRPAWACCTRTRGAASVLGLDPWRDAAALHRRLAYVPGDVSLWPNLTGGEVIDLLGALRGGLDRPRRAALIERFQLDPTKKCRAYSKGNRQKVALVAAFASDVELYLLDEPTSGLDPLMMAVFQDVVREAHDAGSTVLLSSHILSEVEALCDRLTIIRAGRAAESGTLRGAAPPDAHDGRRRDGRAAGRAGRAAGGARREHRRHPRRVLRRPRRPEPGAGAPRQRSTSAP